MSDHVFELLADFALNTLADAERDRVDAHVTDCDQCAAELATTHAALASVAAPLPGVSPCNLARGRLLDALGEGTRFDDFSERVARLFDIPVGKAQRYLARIDDPSRWAPGPGTGVFLLPINPGPKFEGSMSGFVKVNTGSEFPEHTHNGDEATIVLQGACKDPDGTIYRRHMDISYGRGSSHSFTAIEDISFIAAVRLAGGFQLA